MIRIALISPLVLAACGAPEPDVTRFAPDYLGATASLLDEDLVQIDAKMTGARDNNDISAYAKCAVAQYTLIHGYGFARHLRTNVNEKGGVWAADAVYTISPSLPRGLATIDAEVVVASCAENGIPTV